MWILGLCIVLCVLGAILSVGLEFKQWLDDRREVKADRERMRRSFKEPPSALPRSAAEKRREPTNG